MSKQNVHEMSMFENETNLSIDIPRKKEIENLEKIIPMLSSLNLDPFIVGNYIDAVDETKQWCVAEILERQGDNVLIHFEGWSSKLDEKVNIKRTAKINHFRRYSRNYSGQKRTAYRMYTYSQVDYDNIKSLIEKLRQSKFLCFDAMETTQILRGKIYTYLDIFMTTNYGNLTEKIVPQVVDLLYDYLDLVVDWLEFYKENFHLSELLIKNPDLFLIDAKSAVMSCTSEICHSLKRIFGGDYRVSEFFRSNDSIIKKIKPRTEKKYCSDISYKANYEKENFTVICIANFIDYFGSKNGFDLLFDIVTMRKDSGNTIPNYPYPISTLPNFLSVFLDVDSCIHKKFNMSSQYLQVKDHLVQRISNMSENEIKETKKSTISYLSSLLKNLLSNTDKRMGMTIYEELVQIYQIKCLSSKNLNKRIQGISFLTNLIEAVMRKDARLPKENKTEEEMIFEIATSNSVLAFIKENKVLDLILGDNIHEEIIRRSLPVFKLLANKKQLDTGCFDLLWKTMMEKHESISQKVEELICEISTFISDSEKVYIFNKLKDAFLYVCSQKNRDYQEIQRYLKFISKFTVNSISKTGVTTEQNENLYYGIPVIWNYIINVEENQEILNLAINSFTEIFHESYSIDDNIKEKYILGSFLNIKNGNCIVQSLKLAKKLFFDLREGNKNKKNINRIIKRIDDSVKIVSVILEDFARYIIGAKEKIVKMNSNNQPKEFEELNSNIITIDRKQKLNSSKGSIKANQSNSNLDDSMLQNQILESVFEGIYTHKQNIEIRLDTLNFFLTDQPGIQKVFFSIDQIEYLWSLLVKNRNSDLEQNLFFRFLNRKSMDSEDSFVSKISDYLFLKILCDSTKFDTVEIYPIGFSLFKKFFTSVNLKSSKLVKDCMNLRVSSDEIIGLPTMVNILCNSKNNSVKENAAQFLVQLTLSLRTYNEDFALKYWNKLIIVQIFSMLRKSIEMSNGYAIKGIVYYLKTLLYEIEKLEIDVEIPNSDTVNFASDGIDYTFTNSDKSEKRNSRVSINDFVYEVRYRMAYFYDIPFSKLTLKCGKKLLDLSDDFKVFREIVPTNYIIECREGVHPIFTMKANPKSLIFSDKDLFKMLYRLLLNTDAIYIEDCWELINLLPSDKDLELEVLNCKNIQKLLNMDYLYMTSYNLKLMRNFMSDASHGNKVIDEKSSHIRSWMEQMLKLKGVDHLVNLICNQPRDFSKHLILDCLVDELILVKEIFSSYAKDSSGLFSIVKPDDLISNLLSVISAIISSSMEVDKDEKLNSENSEFRRRREKMLSNRSLNEENEDTAIKSDMDDICESLAKVWIGYDNALFTIIRFFEIFDLPNKTSHNINRDSIIMHIMKDDTTQSKFTQEILINGLIRIANFKIKDTILYFINTTVNTATSPKKNFLNYLFGLLFSKETQIIALNNLKTSEKFFTVFANLLTNHFEYEEHIDKQGLASSIVFFVDYIKQFSIEDNQLDIAVEGYLNILRILSIKSNSLKKTMLDKFNIVDLLLIKCIFSKCQGKRNFIFREPSQGTIPEMQNKPVCEERIPAANLTQHIKQRSHIPDNSNIIAIS